MIFFFGDLDLKFLAKIPVKKRVSLMLSAYTDRKRTKKNGKIVMTNKPTGKLGEVLQEKGKSNENRS